MTRCVTALCGSGMDERLPYTHPVKLYRTKTTVIAEETGRHFEVRDTDFHALTTRDDLGEYLQSLASRSPVGAAPNTADLLPPIASQEVWAAGVTYFRSRTARMEESQTAGGGSFYDRVYNAERPELFFKATAARVIGPGAAVHIRNDSHWNVPEPELTLLISPSGHLAGFTIGNDMSSRDIEGENPLYLPQAKVYTRSCALGPCILIGSEPLPPDTPISIQILRSGAAVFTDSITLAQMKRSPAELISFLYRENSFPNGAFLLTGTGIVPPDSFTLHRGDVIRITIDPIGTLENTVD